MECAGVGAEDMTDLGEGDDNNMTTGGGRVPEAEVDWLLLLMEGDHHHHQTDPAEAATSCEMDRDLWAKLPLDFLDRVLVRLPLVSHLRFQSVCKQWRATLSAPAFLQSRAALAATTSSSSASSSAGPPICLCQIESGCPKEKSRPSTLPSTSLCKSFKLDLSFLPRKLSYPRLYDKGLLCFRSEPSAAEDVVSLCVCNPVTKTWTELPEFTSSRAHQLRMAMVLDGGSGVPQVVVLHGEVADQGELGRNQSVWTIRTCSTAAASSTAAAQQGGGGTQWEWTVRRADPPCPLLTRSTFAMCRGRLFVLVFGVHLLLYAADGRLLERFDVTNPCMHHAAHRLLEHRGQVLLCGHYRLGLPAHQQQELTVRIWRLDQAKMVFEQVSALPERQVRELLQGWDVADADVELLDCRALADDSVCLHLEVYNLLTGVVRNWVLAFHAAHLTWRLAPMDYLPYKSLTLFEPKLDLFL